ncbi:MAG TPA: PqqD family peptide modification chaperone [Acidimicrobiales bacterium]|nr:PqqD family peptide modification chaperone [Acidimicrobiales bacterium]
MAGERRRDDLRWRDWKGAGEGGLVVFDPVTDRGHLLNPASAAVFEACDGRTPVDEMAHRVAERTGLPEDPEIVELALSELADAGLLQEPDLASSHLSRRSLMARLAVGAGVAALLPVIETIANTSELAAATAGRPQTAEDSLVAVPKTATTTVGTPVVLTLSTSGGFSDPAATVFAIATTASHGDVSLTDDVATYAPADGFTGTDTFTYIAAQCIPFSDAIPLPACPDGSGPVPEAGTAPATVTVTVNPAPTTTTSTTEAPTTTAAVAPATAAQPTFTG